MFRHMLSTVSAHPIFGGISGSLFGMAQAQANGITIDYEVFGEGEPLLLVMGLGGQRISWPRGFVSALADRGFQVITMDNRDSGLSAEMSGPPPTPWQFMRALVAPAKLATQYYLADMANDCIGLLDHLGIESAHVVGMSMGGMITQTLAIDHPTRVRSIASIMSTTGNRRVGRIAPKLIAKIPKLTKSSRDTMVNREVELFRLISGSSFDEAETRYLSQIGVERSYRPEGTRRQTAAIFASPDRTEKLRKLNLPALVIHGLEDTLVQPSGGIATARAIPNARLLMFPDMGHNLPKPRWNEMFDAIVINTRRTRELPMLQSV